MQMASPRQRLTSSDDDVLEAPPTWEWPPALASGVDTLFHARYGCYLVLDFEPEQAFFLAMTPDVGIVDALTLIENGCPHETAVSILA